MASTRHIPVLLNEVLEYLNVKQGGVFLDCTVGGGGHAEAILAASDNSYLTGLDRDPGAIQKTTERLESYRGRIELIQAPFSSAGNVLAGKKFDGVLADLGMSTDQLYDQRGFSFSEAAALDMRMDPGQELSAEQVVNHYSFGELIRVLKKGGVGKEARPIANGIIDARPIKDTQQLAQVVAQHTPAKIRAEKHRHPATVVFQAIRIEVNSEFKEIEALLDAAPELVREGGRLAVISFHSAEDKLVTKRMRSWRGSRGPALSPQIQGEKCYGKLLTPKAVTPTDEEIQSNPASRSAMLRVFEFSGSE